MRTLLLIAILSIALVAGCATKPADNPGGTNNSTGSGGDMGNMTMGKEAVKDTHSFAPVPPPATSKAFKMDAGYTMLNLTVSFTPISPAPAGVASGVSVKVGSLTCTLADGPVTAASKCTKTGTATPGDMKIEYAGNGPVTASVTVMES